MAGLVGSVQSADKEKGPDVGASALCRIQIVRDVKRMQETIQTADEAVKRVTVDPETGEVRSWVERGRKGSREWVEAYDRDAAELERWMLQGFARRLLFDLETRQVRLRVPYSEVAPYTELAGRRVRYALVRETYRLEADPVPVYTRLEDRAVIDRRERKAARFRVINCSRNRVGKAGAEIWRATESGRTRLHQVAVCGSVWTCPVCSRRIGLERQRHLAAAYGLVVDGGNGCGRGDAVMVTLTIRHGVGDDLARLFQAIKAADGLQQKTYIYKRLVGYRRTVNKRKVAVPSELGYVGRVSATEVTHGRNGWHPHLHQLWFFNRRLTAGELERLRAELFSVWRDACLAVGLPAPLEFSKGRRALGVDVRRALSASEYLTKFGRERSWSVERELVSAHTKRARGGRTPFQLLADYARGDRAAGGLFRVYAEATLGGHQLQWSKGLKRLLQDAGLDDVLADDEALAGRLADGSEHMGTLDDEDWCALVGAERFGIEAYGPMLVIAARQGFDAAVSFLRGLPSYAGVTRAADRERAESDAWASRAVVEVRRITERAFGRRGSAALESALSDAVRLLDGRARYARVMALEREWRESLSIAP